MRPQLLRNIGVMVSHRGVAKKQGRRVLEKDLGIAKRQALLIDEQGCIAWMGAERNIPKQLSSSALQERNLQGATLLPGLVDCHTHTVFAGSRATEFEQRLRGASYQEISKKGGGILSTVRAVRKATQKELRELAQSRVDRFLRQGVTTLEIKTGYGLSFSAEQKMLSVIGELQGPAIVPTWLAVHAKGPTYKTSEDHLRAARSWLKPLRRSGLVERVDIYWEPGFFHGAEAISYLQEAKELGFQLTLHADQLSGSGGAELAVRLGAQSADHVIKTKAVGIAALAKSPHTVAVLLPMADLYLRCAYPPARKLIDAGACVALASDFNPGTAPSQDWSLVGLLARLNMGMTLPEVLAASTYGGAMALGLAHDRGALLPGHRADLWAVQCDWDQLFYSAGTNPTAQVWVKGRCLQA